MLKLDVHLMILLMIVMLKFLMTAPLIMLLPIHVDLVLVKVTVTLMLQGVLITLVPVLVKKLLHTPMLVLN